MQTPNYVNKYHKDMVCNLSRGRTLTILAIAEPLGHWKANKRRYHIRVSNMNAEWVTESQLDAYLTRHTKQTPE